jgi:hypothetical protein
VSNQDIDMLGERFNGSGITVGDPITDPKVLAQFKASEMGYRRNEAWMQAHWEERWPHARGKTLVVAGQEAFIADIPDEALARAHAPHPTDVGVVRRYVFPDKGPRIYVVQG